MRDDIANKMHGNRQLTNDKSTQKDKAELTKSTKKLSIFTFSV